MNGADYKLLLQDTAVRILVFGGLLLLVINMLVGEVFAIFISHVANGEIRDRWVEVLASASAGQLDVMQAHFDRIEYLLDRRGRIMNSHSHAGAFGMLALLLAIVQPLLSWSTRTRTWIAAAMITGGLLQPLFIFTSSWTGAWANYLSHVGALLIGISLVLTIMGIIRAKRSTSHIRELVVTLTAPESSRILLRWGALLILVGMCFGFYYAWVFTSQHEPRQFELMDSMLASVTTAAGPDRGQLVKDYRRNNSLIAITTAVHSHAIEMGTIALLLAFVQSFLFYSARTRKIWARVFLVGAWLLPFFIYNATIYGLRSAAFADLSGFIVIVALLAMLGGLARHTGVEDARG